MLVVNLLSRETKGPQQENVHIRRQFEYLNRICSAHILFEPTFLRLYICSHEWHDQANVRAVETFMLKVIEKL